MAIDNTQQLEQTHTQALADNGMHVFMGEVDNEHIQEGDIEIVPVSFMRGRTFLDSIVIVDEAQNVTHEQME